VRIIFLPLLFQREWENLTELLFLTITINFSSVVTFNLVCFRSLGASVWVMEGFDELEQDSEQTISRLSCVR
jgi:hypothetical protein